jgi:hypothetical protein
MKNMEAMQPMKAVAKKEVKAHEMKMHGKKYKSGGTVRGTGCATKGKKFSGVY